MAPITVRRRCPFCRKSIVLGSLPIVATNVRFGPAEPAEPGSGAADRREPRPRSGAPVKGFVGDWPVVADPPLPGREDGLLPWLIRQTVPAELPSVTALAEVADLPARICLSCENPLPEDIDDRESFTIAIVGTTGAGKSHYLASMLQQAARRQLLGGVGCREFVLDERSGTVYTQRYYVPVFREHVQLDHTVSDPDVVRKPLACRVTFNDAQPALVLFHDVAGEVLGERTRRAAEAGFLRRPDAVIFLVDPVCLDRPDGGRWEPEGFDDFAYSNQADLLAATLNEMTPADRSRIPIAITLSKSDLLASVPAIAGCREFRDEPDTTSRGAWNASLERVDAEVREILRRCGAVDVLAAAASLRPEQVSFHAVAALGCRPDPKTGKVPALNPTRCLDPLVTVLFRIPGLAHAG